MWLIWQRLDPRGWKDGVSVRRLSASVHCCEFIFPRQTFWHPPDSRKSKSFMFNCYIPTALWWCHPKGTQTYIFRREAMGCRFIPQPMAWSLFPCGREDAQSLHLQSCAPGAHLQASPPDYAVIWDQMSLQSSPGSSLPPSSLSFHHMESSQMGKNQLTIIQVSLLISASSLWSSLEPSVAGSSLSQTWKALFFLPLP